jgi:hypothetical protein
MPEPLKPNSRRRILTKDEALKLALIIEEFDGNDESLPLELLKPIAETLRALAQPVQEPVAWAIYDKRGGSKSLHWPNQHSPDGDATKFDAVPLYATPPQRQWVGLTFAEICELENESLLRFARAIEAKLKEKNA